MRVTRLYIAAQLATGATARLDGGAATHLRRVLRAQPGDRIVLFNGSGADFAAEIISFDGDGALLRVGVGEPAAASESPLHVTLLQGVSRGERMDFVLQKATELGVAAIAPVLTERSVVRLDSDQAQRRLAHWRGVAIAACEQCGRATVPRVEPPATLEQRLAHGTAAASRVMLAPDGDRPLADAVRDAARVELLIGPEGGLSARERELARTAGFVAATLGPRVLRTETAALVALAVAQQVAGDLGAPRVGA
jgi:16S rRNA (uracil1498-N3)-methyltransferase